MYFPKWQHKWEPAVVSLTFFCLNALVSSMSGILVNVLDATGKVKTTLRLMVMWTILTWVLTPLFIHLYGYNGVAFASFLVTLTIIVTVRLVQGIIAFDFLKSIYKSFIATLGMAIVAYGGCFYFVHSFLSLLIVILVSGSFYLIIFYFLSREQIHDDIKLFR